MGRQRVLRHARPDHRSHAAIRLSGPVFWQLRDVLDERLPKFVCFGQKTARFQGESLYAMQMGILDRRTEDAKIAFDVFRPALFDDGPGEKLPEASRQVGMLSTKFGKK